MSGPASSTVSSAQGVDLPHAVRGRVGRALARRRPREHVLHQQTDQAQKRTHIVTLFPEGGPARAGMARAATVSSLWCLGKGTRNPGGARPLLPEGEYRWSFRAAAKVLAVSGATLEAILAPAGSSGSSTGRSTTPG